MLLVALGAPRAQEGEATGTTNERSEVERPGRTGLPIPRFVSLQSNEINLRKGPGIRYPIKWVYRRRGLPVEIIDEFTTWRRIRDWEGTVGWVHQSMLSGKRTLRILPGAEDERRILLYEHPSNTAEAVAELEPGALGNLESCEDTWCRAAFSGLEGWLPRTAFFGAYENEELD
ncbi:SH3 domain-containing protein [Fodinicurvata sediminis]|uniref:SH3 domain-containing protein n=1 Tax=Fodinicurvata sediminis TaxID=1121832 RepID=UPI0009DBC488|nr:SH3 domain-containing protein [Fodinicurvata sediminis]